MNTERLLRLADHLDTVPDAAFDMEYWGREVEGCGTTCCALGHACSVPEFAAAGLRLEWDKKSHNGERGAIVRHGPTCGRSCLTSIDAARSFFGLDYEQSRHLFDPDRHYDADGGVVRPTPKDVAARIRGLVAGEAA